MNNHYDNMFAISQKTKEILNYNYKRGAFNKFAKIEKDSENNYFGMFFCGDFLRAYVVDDNGFVDYIGLAEVEMRSLTRMQLSCIKIFEKDVGVGSAMLNFLIECAENIGIKEITLQSHGENNYRFYKRFGFEIDERNRVNEELIPMRLQL